jgi:hypothetical protein
MRLPKILRFACMAIVVLIALGGAERASATVLTSPEGTVLKTGSTIHAVNSGTSTLTTSFKNIECSESTVQAKTTNESGTTVSGSVESLTFGKCNCEVKTLKNGTLSIQWTSGNNGTLSSSSAEVTTTCSTIFGSVHCIYVTSSTTLGTVTGGSPAKVDISSANLPRLTTNGLCAEKANWDATYEITSPKPLYVDNSAGGGATETTLTTSLSGEEKSGAEITVNEGSKVKDTATLSGTNASKATGTVKYKVYADKECKELVTSAGEVTVTGGSIPASEEKELEAGRVYYWQAEYSGDTNNLKSTSTCGKEVLTVKAKTSLTTSLSGEAKSGEEITVNEGSKVKDTATLSGTKSSTATGKVKFRVYKDKECKELAAEAGEGSLSEGKASSEEKTLEAGAVYYWQAEYPGDSLHQASTSTCGEVATVKANTSIATTLSGGEETGEEVEVEEAEGATDSATLSGTNVSKASGKVKYKVYSDEECEELVTTAGEATVSGASVPTSSEVKLSDGFYFWQATYEGDSTHSASTSACGSEVEIVAEEVSVAISLIGEAEAGSEIEVEEVNPVAAEAILSGPNVAEATGFVSYSVYYDSKCEELALEAGEARVEEGVVAVSSEVELPAGTYYWRAKYSGDTQNKTAVSTCGAGIEITRREPLTTILSGEAESGTEITVEEEAPVTDTATINEPSASTATGTVQYKVYSDEECEELAASAGEVAVLSGGTVPTSSEVSLPGGTYFWQAEYSGDLSHAATTSACGSEIEVVGDATSISTSLSGEEESGAEIEVRAVANVTDTAALSGANALKATGTVQYGVYEDSKCENLLHNAGTVEVTEGVVPKSEEVPLPAGTFYWQAQYFGDGKNQGSTSSCGSEVAHVGSALVTSILSGGGQESSEIEVAEEVSVTDTATINEENASTATGTVKYKVYSDPECKELTASAGEVSVSKGVVPASGKEELTQGTYYWQAEYSGDETHEAATSPCGEAQQNVNLPWIVSVGDSYISGEGGRWAGNINIDVAPVTRIIDALEGTAYTSHANDEVGGEAIPKCHRSASAEIFIGPPGVRSTNLACSGAETASVSVRNRFGLTAATWKPGLDFAKAQAKDPINPANLKQGICGLANGCKGQALMLQEWAEQPFNKQKKDIKMVVLSIGGNDFGFDQIVARCAVLFSVWFKECRNDGQVKPHFEPAAVGAVRNRIKQGIKNIGNALLLAKYKPGDFTILVQDYPSPLPANGKEFRYDGLLTPLRNQPGRCPFYNNDANWANEMALKTINQTVREAAEEVVAEGVFNVKLMQLEGAFNGRRLCEKGVEQVHLVGPGIHDWGEKGAVDKTEWINQVRVLNIVSPFQIQEDFHPDYWGQLALRNCVRRAYNNGKPAGGKCLIDGAGLSAPPGAPIGWRLEPRMKLE